MAIDGSRLTALTALDGALQDTDLLYVVRGGSGRKGLGSQIRVTSARITDATTVGKAILTAINEGAVIAALGLGDLAELDTVGASQIDNQAITTDKMANLASGSILLGDGSNRPTAYATGATGRAVLAAADTATALAALELGTMAQQDAEAVDITGGTAVFTGPVGSALAAVAADGEVAIADGIVDIGNAIHYRGELLVGPPATPIADPTGGGVVDAECRAALIELLDTLRVGGEHGLIRVAS